MFEQKNQTRHGEHHNSDPVNKAKEGGMSMKRVLTMVLVCILVLCFCGIASAKMTFKLGMVAPPTHPQAKANLIFADYIKTKTNGEITVDVFPMGQLGGERSMVEQVQGGTLDMADITTAVLSNFVPQAALYDMPFIWPTREIAYKVLADAEFWKIMSDTFPPKGMVAFGYGENEIRDLTNVKREIRKPDDVKGLKIRVMEAPIYLETWRTLGANPVPMPFPEIYNALQQGVIDAQENPIMTSSLMKFTEVTPYATILNYCLTECIKIANVDVWKKLTPDQQKIFYEAAQIAIKANREEGLKMTSDIVEKMKSEGKVKVTQLTAEERAAFQQAVKPVYEAFDKKMGTIPNKPEYGAFAGKSYLQMAQEKVKQYQK
jgi:tripartite ATP-independent transporter DctP family solute receptor